MPASAWVAARILNALESINSNHGRGEIVGVDFQSNSVRIFIPHANVEWVKFRTDGAKVHFRGRRRSY